MNFESFYTGLSFCGQKILLESAGDKKIDAALKSTFKDDYRRTAPLRMAREDVQIVLAHSRRKMEKKKGTKS